MASAAHEAVLTSEGKLVVPTAVREARHWEAGTRLVFEDREDGVLLKAAPLFKPTTVDDGFGLLAGSERLSFEEIDAALEAEGARRARD